MFFPSTFFTATIYNVKLMEYQKMNYFIELTAAKKTYFHFYTNSYREFQFNKNERENVFFSPRKLIRTRLAR